MEWLETVTGDDTLNLWKSSAHSKFWEIVSDTLEFDFLAFQLYHTRIELLEFDVQAFWSYQT
jgi:hypothetical protein